MGHYNLSIYFILNLLSSTVIIQKDIQEREKQSLLLLVFITFSRLLSCWKRM